MCHQVSLTFHFDCGVGIWRHVEGVNAHVFPGIVCPWFDNSTTEMEHVQLRFMCEMVIFVVPLQVIILDRETLNEGL